MRCLETRRKDGMKWRRYRTEDGRIVTTYEVPVAVLRGAAPMSKLRQRLEQWQRGEEMRARKALVLQRLAEGIKPLAIAHEVGMTERTVQRIRERHADA